MCSLITKILLGSNTIKHVSKFRLSVSTARFESADVFRKVPPLSSNHRHRRVGTGQSRTGVGEGYGGGYVQKTSATHKVRLLEAGATAVNPLPSQMFLMRLVAASCPREFWPVSGSPSHTAPTVHTFPRPFVLENKRSQKENEFRY